MDAKNQHVQAASQQVSIAIQQALKKNLLFFDLSDIHKLVTWPPPPPSWHGASIRRRRSFEGSTFSSTEGKDVVPGTT